VKPDNLKPIDEPVSSNAYYPKKKTDQAIVWVVGPSCLHNSGILRKTNVLNGNEASVDLRAAV